jgi:hypothetical protein
MSENTTPPAPPYFSSGAEGHFRIRPDLLEELCFEEAMTLALPKNEKAYARWLNLCGFTAKDYSFIRILEETDLRYQPTNRVLLHTAVLPGHSHRTSLISDARRWSAPCEPGGLFEFVLLRAVEYVGCCGFSRKHAWDCLHVRPEHNRSPLRKMAPWSVGYDQTTGFCRVLYHEPAETEARYLTGQ